MEQISSEYPLLETEIRKLDSFLYSRDKEKAWDGSKLLIEIAKVNKKRINPRLPASGALENALNPT